MLNQLVLVGRVSRIEKEGDNVILTLKVPRTFKNENGEYENDYIETILSGNIGENVMNYCKNEDIVGVKGRIQSKMIEKYHTKMNIMEIIAEKVTFLSSKSE